MTLSAGQRLGPYEIVGPLGAGGMGEVWTARDTRLDRLVAVKVLPRALAIDPGRRARFEREARAIAALGHPNVCALFDVGRADGPDGGTLYLVMERLDGETLASRLRRGRLSVPEAIQLGVHLADALAAAHRRGIVHRDLKPGNVMLTPAGAKLLDFGLASQDDSGAGAAAGGETATNPTMTFAPDRPAVVAGTAPYLAPERLRGQSADARSDIFALGCVLFEAFAGRRAFAGATRDDIVGALLDPGPAPDLREASPAVPPALALLVGQCLAKDPDTRWQCADDVTRGLRLVEEGASRPGEPRGATGRWRTIGPGVLALAAAAVALTLFLTRPSPPPSPRPIRFSLPPPPGHTFALELDDTLPLALSPDGSQIAFVARNSDQATRLWLRPLAATEARPLPGTDGAQSPFWSPDGRSLAFFAGGKLQRFDLPAGPALLLCDAPSGATPHGTWGRDGRILFASVQGEALYSASTAGGESVAAVRPDAPGGRVSWPAFLPDGRHFLYLERAPDGRDRILLAGPDRPPRAVLSAASNVQYVDPGYLVFAREGTLLGQRFDLVSGRVAGEPFLRRPAAALLPLLGAGRVHGLPERGARLRLRSRHQPARVDRSCRTRGRECGRPRGQPAGSDLARRAAGSLRPRSTWHRHVRPVDG